ncbi:hypothetical protein SOM12_04665 [Flavobacterium sp. CFBP9031]|jgi:hypothetical protein|uniref:hypothetical protein n=1 Tax=Flavobacterium sp. CFBP9031 TaxID=3096538 RepID=UPI002A6A850C|nr:hypothetical protein [Flavobacterium sp. CFBP9031]MDY0986697.1 hypothetical protein [Flavobacterium sp. CFBP9031]
MNLISIILELIAFFEDKQQLANFQQLKKLAGHINCSIVKKPVTAKAYAYSNFTQKPPKSNDFGGLCSERLARCSQF